MDQPTLLSALKTLDALFRRNKNQHGAATWWRHLAGLRRALHKLAVEQHLAQDETVARRAAFVRAEVVPRCFRAFGHVVADRQYAPLGAVLMGVLARVNRALEAGEPKGEGEGASVESPEVARAEKKAEEPKAIKAQKSSKPQSSIDAIFAGLA